MPIEQWIAQGAAVFAGLTSLQIALLAAGLLLQGAFLAVVPEEAILLALGALCAQARIEYPLAFAAVLLGLLPANLIAVAIGRKLGAKLLARASVVRAAEWIRRRGPVVIVITRFIPSSAARSIWPSARPVSRSGASLRWTRSRPSFTSRCYSSSVDSCLKFRQ